MPSSALRHSAAFERVLALAAVADPIQVRIIVQLAAAEEDPQLW